MPLRKAYSESLAPVKQREAWQRSRSHPTKPQTPDTQPLALVSEATINKLHRFQFRQQDAAAEGVHEKLEDPFRDARATVATDSSPAAIPAIPGTGGTKTSPAAGKSKDDSAITPLSKLTWRELVEPEAATTIDEPLSVSPTDRVLWDARVAVQYGPQPNIQSVLPRTARKRARSSSPMSSPCANNPSTPLVNIKKLAQAVKSPNADPTLELWDRFALNGAGMGAPIGFRNPALADLMVSSSPRPSKKSDTPRLDPGLRKVVSCGRYWSKRRKIEHTEGTEGTVADMSKSSLVTALLDTVTSSMQEESSNTQPNSLSSDWGEAENAAPEAEAVLRNAAATASDYGDDDFDEDTYMQLDATYVDGDTTLVQDGTPGEAPAPEANAKPVDSEDEFGEVDDDILDAVEGIMANLESGSTQQAVTPAKPPIQGAAPGKTAEKDLEDEFGDDFGEDFDFEAAELAATQSALSSATAAAASQKPRAIQRYLVTNVLDAEYTDGRQQPRSEKILLVQADNTKTLKTIHLRDAWIDTPAHPKAFVHIIGQFSADGRCIIDDSENIIILHPDQLISATVVADSFSCMRRAVLQDRVKATSDSSAPLVYGTMLHEIFQEALTANQWDLPSLSKIIDRVTEKHVEDLYTIKVGMNIAKEHLHSKMPELALWAAAFISSDPKDEAVVHDRNGKKVNMCISKLLDVEEHVWSPMFGLKGNIDATVQVTMKDGQDVKTLTVPFEVKTGRHATPNHVAQTALYNLLLSDRYDVEIAYGILYYMETSQTTRIPTIRRELQHMIMERNLLACYIRERSTQLPPMKKSKNLCGRCYAKTSCFIYHKLADDGDGESSGMDNKFDEVVQHLTPTHQEFFLKWEKLLTLEEKETQKMKRELWTMVSSEREKVGRCFSDVVVEEGSAMEEKDSPKINRFRYTFVKHQPPPGFSFMESQLGVGEPIIVSDEKGHFALALGYVTAVRKQRISVAVDRRLHNARIRQAGFNVADNQVFGGIMEVASEGSTPEQSQGKLKTPPIRYRLDKDEFSNGMAVVRNNLVQVMANGVFGSSETRRLVVDLVAPRFKTAPTQYTIQGSESLNVDQHRAIEKVMSAQDYALVLGMPGTGKTTTIAHIIRALTSQGKSVLLTSYTHTAVDNILLKLKDDKTPILRLGAPAKVHHEVQEFVTLAGERMTTFEAIKQAWHDTPIVATTCLGIGHPIFNERTFDYCIVDEASQITLPICLGPIRMARTFVLVGDHNQLPPLVQNEEARLGGLDVSLFKLLSDTHPDSVVNLEHQYRMCEDIMTLSNTLIYKGRLRCGTEELRMRKLHIPNMAGLKQRHYDASSALLPGTPRSVCPGPQANCWLRQLLDPEARVRFINTDTLQPRPHEEAKGSRIVNPAEASVVVQLVGGLLAVGVPEAEIGVMTHYRSQLALLRHGLRAHARVEMHTADRFQGRDKAVVVLSLVRSNGAGAIGDLLRDWRRVNVALTRAKAKLLVVGSRETLLGAGPQEVVGRFVALAEERGWVFDLPADALASHPPEEAATQGAGPASLSPTRRAGLSPGKGAGGKENQRPEPKRARVGEVALMRGKLITRDILNEMSNGAY